MKHRTEADGPCGIFYGENFMFLSKINEKEIKNTHKKLQQMENASLEFLINRLSCQSTCEVQ